MPNEDETLRSWALSHSIDNNKRGTSIEHVIKDAQLYYGFMTNNKAELLDIKSKKKDKP